MSSNNEKQFQEVWLQSWWKILRCIPNEYRTHMNGFAKYELKYGPIPRELFKEKEAVRELLKFNHLPLPLASKPMFLESAMARVKKDPYALRFLPQSLRDNFEVVMEAVKHDGRSLEKASPRMQDNLEVVMKAVNAYG